MWFDRFPAGVLAGTLLTVLLASACPVSVSISPVAPAEKVQKKLLGRWATEEETSMAFRIQVSKSAATAHTLTVLEKGVAYTEENVQYELRTTRIGTENIVCLKPAQGETRYFLYSYIFHDKNTLETRELAAEKFDLDHLRDAESLRSELAVRMEAGDCFSPRTLWTRR